MLYKTMISSVLWIFSLYLVYCVMLFLFQRQIIFPAGMAGPAPGPAAVPGLDIVWFDLDGNRVEAWYLPPADDPKQKRRPVVIFAHGNAELIDGCLEEFSAFTQFGLGLLLVEYPGYGRSRGRPSQAGIDAVYTAAYDWLAARPDVDPHRIVLAGRSLGSGVACQLAAKRSSAAMILISSFTSVRSFAGRYGVPAFLVRDPFDNLAAIRTYPKPLLVFHGLRDDVIPFAHGLDIAAAAPLGRIIRWECAHNDCPPDRRAFFKDIAVFLRDAGVLTTSRGRTIRQGFLREP